MSKCTWMHVGMKSKLRTSISSTGSTSSISSTGSTSNISSISSIGSSSRISSAGSSSSAVAVVALVILV